MKERKNKFVFGGIVVVLLFAGVYSYLSTVSPAYPESLENVVITMTRGSCYGPCPAYTLTMRGDGSVVYEGSGYVAKTGRHTDRISPEKVRELVDLFYEAGFFSMKDEYTAPITDLPTVVTSITIGSRTKEVVDYWNAPERLKDLEKSIDEVANSKQWVGDCHKFGGCD